MSDQLRNTIQCILIALVGTLLITITCTADRFSESWGFAAIGAVCFVYAMGKMNNPRP